MMDHYEIESIARREAERAGATAEAEARNLADDERREREREVSRLDARITVLSDELRSLREWARTGRE